MSRNSFAGNIKRISGNVFNRQLGVFLIFVVISAVLWLVTTLNEVTQRQVEYKIQITNIPDSVVFVNSPPSDITVNIRGRGSHFIRDLLGFQPALNIDFSAFVKDSRIFVSKKDLTTLIKSDIGDGQQIQDINPDSISVLFTVSQNSK